MQQAKRLCDELIFMDKGKVIEMGESHQLIYNPKCESTKLFISGELITDIPQREEAK
jgi:tungstate transport system ATP-binding protein